MVHSSAWLAFQTVPGRREGGPSGPLFCYGSGLTVNGLDQEGRATAMSAQRDALSERKTSTGKAAEIEALLEPTLEAMGYRVVRILLSGDRKQKRLQIMAERADESGMDVEGCSEVSRAAEAILDVEDPIDSAYTLEVSSPGIDRPLTRAEDFERWAGFEAKVEMLTPHEGRKRFKGTLLGLSNGNVRIAAEDGEYLLSYADIAKAKLVLTDALIEAAKKASEGTDG